MDHRETLIIKIHDAFGHVGFGEIVAFNDPFYTEETIEIAKRISTETILPQLMGMRIEHPFEIHSLFDNKYPMTVAGFENALLDLYSKRKKQFILDLVFQEEMSSEIASGIAIGDGDIDSTIKKMNEYHWNGHSRFKIKISPLNGFEKMKAIREAFPDMTLLVDANRSYGIDDINELRKFDALDLACIEEPLRKSDFQFLPELQRQMKTPVCLDESILSMEDLENAIKLKAFKVLNIKIGRVGGLFYAKQMIEMCREHDIKFWIGSMLESGISKILHVYLSSLKDVYIPGDLSASERYFDHDLIRPDIKVVDGKIRVRKGVGLGVEVDEMRLVSQTIDYHQVDLR